MRSSAGETQITKHVRQAIAAGPPTAVATPRRRCRRCAARTSHVPSGCPRTGCLQGGAPHRAMRRNTPKRPRPPATAWSTRAHGLGHWDGQYLPTGRAIMPTADSARQPPVLHFGWAATRAVPLPTGHAADRLDNSRSTDRLDLDGGVRRRCSRCGENRLSCVTGPASRPPCGNPRRLRQGSRPGRHRRPRPNHFGRPKPRRKSRIQHPVPAGPRRPSGQAGECDRRVQSRRHHARGHRPANPDRRALVGTYITERAREGQVGDDWEDRLFAVFWPAVGT